MPADFEKLDSIIPIENNYGYHQQLVMPVKDNTTKRAKAEFDRIQHEREEKALLNDPWDE